MFPINSSNTVREIPSWVKTISNVTPALLCLRCLKRRHIIIPHSMVTLVYVVIFVTLLLWKVFKWMHVRCSLLWLPHDVYSSFKGFFNLYVPLATCRVGRNTAAFDVTCMFFVTTCYGYMHYDKGNICVLNYLKFHIWPPFLYLFIGFFILQTYLHIFRGEYFTYSLCCVFYDPVNSCFAKPETMHKAGQRLPCVE